MFIEETGNCRISYYFFSLMFTHPSRMIRLIKWNKFVSHKHQLSKCFEKHILALSNAQRVAPEIPINLPKNQKLPDKKKNEILPVRLSGTLGRK